MHIECGKGGVTQKSITITSEQFFLCSCILRDASHSHDIGDSSPDLRYAVILHFKRIYSISPHPYLTINIHNEITVWAELSAAMSRLVRTKPLINMGKIPYIKGCQMINRN